MRGWRKRPWYTLFVYAQFPKDFWEFGNLCKTCSVTLTSVRHPNFFLIKDASYDHTLCGWWRRNDEGIQLFACRICPCVCPSQLNTVARDSLSSQTLSYPPERWGWEMVWLDRLGMWLMQYFPLQFTNVSNEAMQCRPLLSKSYRFRLQNLPKVSHRSIVWPFSK